LENELERLEVEILSLKRFIKDLDSEYFKKKYSKLDRKRVYSYHKTTRNKWTQEKKIYNSFLMILENMLALMRFFFGS
jgi:hypothetical protein